MSLTGLAFLLAFAGAVAIGLFKHPRFALYAYLGIYYLDPPSRWWGASLPPMRWSLVTALVMLLAVARLPTRPDAKPWYTTTPAKILIIWTFWIWLQNLWALTGPIHFEFSVLFTKYVLLFAVMYRLVDSPEEVRDVLVVHIVGCGYLGYLAHIAPPGGRLEGVGGPGIDEANALGMFIGTGVLCGAVMILVERGWRQWVTFAAMPFMLNAIVQSQSRGAMLSVVLGALVLLFLKPKPFAKLFYVYAALGIMAFLVIAQDTFWERMRTLQGVKQEDGQVEMESSAESRIYIAKAQWRMVLDHPFGAGHRGTAELSPHYMEAKWLTKSASDPNGQGARSSHNTFMSALTEQGFPGAVLFLWLVLWVVRQFFLLRKFRATAPNPRSRVISMGGACIAAAFAVLLAGNFTDYLKTEVQIWLYVLIAATMSVLLPRELGLSGQATKKPVHPALLRPGRPAARPSTPTPTPTPTPTTPSRPPGPGSARPQPPSRPGAIARPRIGGGR